MHNEIDRPLSPDELEDPAVRGEDDDQDDLEDDDEDDVDDEQ